MGTIVNTSSIIVGGLLGLRFKKSMSLPIQQSVFQMIGLCVLLIGLTGVLKTMLVVDLTTGSIHDQGALLLLVSLVVGVVIGEGLHLEDRLTKFGLLLETKFSVQGFAGGFINASLIFCIGAMSIIGSFNDGMLHNPDVLFMKAAIDGITSLILASTLGYGVLFSSVTVLVYQGSLTLLASLISPYVSMSLLTSLCMVGYVLVMAIGINFLGFLKIKTVNMLPALLVPILYQVFVFYF